MRRRLILYLSNESAYAENFTGYYGEKDIPQLFKPGDKPCIRLAFLKRLF